MRHNDRYAETYCTSMERRDAVLAEYRELYLEHGSYQLSTDAWVTSREWHEGLLGAGDG